MKEKSIVDIINAIKILHGINKSAIARYLGISRQLLKYYEDNDSFTDEHIEKISILISNPEKIFTNK
tara:strand:+ start:7059 stop:7259 length:201 start_codon:yes stop_codon:yes gene_type:complete